MNKALISIGSNTNPAANIALCRQLLSDTFDRVSDNTSDNVSDRPFDNIRFSITSVTSPYGKVYRNHFLNQLAVVHTSMDMEQVNARLKEIEVAIGRDADDKTTGDVKIDVDLVMWNNRVIKPEDMQRSYIAELLDSFD